MSEPTHRSSNCVSIHQRAGTACPLTRVQGPRKRIIRAARPSAAAGTSMRRKHRYLRGKSLVVPAHIRDLQRDLPAAATPVSDDAARLRAARGCAGWFLAAGASHLVLHFEKSNALSSFRLLLCSLPPFPWSLPFFPIAKTLHSPPCREGKGRRDVYNRKRREETVGGSRHGGRRTTHSGAGLGFLHPLDAHAPATGKRLLAMGGWRAGCLQSHQQNPASSAAALRAQGSEARDA